MKKSTNNRGYSMHSFYTGLLDLRRSLSSIIINSCNYCGGLTILLENIRTAVLVINFKVGRAGLWSHASATLLTACSC